MLSNDLRGGECPLSSISYPQSITMIFSRGDRMTIADNLAAQGVDQH